MIVRHHQRLDREGHRLQDQLAQVRLAARKVITRHGLGRRADRRGRLEPDRRGGVSQRHGHAAVLDPRRHRRRPRRWWCATARASTDDPQTSRARSSACPSSRPTHFHTHVRARARGASTRARCRCSTCSPTEIAAAWERGDIDAAFVWDPALGADQAERQGDDHLGRAVGKKGKATFDGMVVDTRVRRGATRSSWRSSSRPMADADAAYRDNKAAWDARLGRRPRRSSRMVGGEPEDVAEACSSCMPSRRVEQQASAAPGSAAAPTAARPRRCRRHRRVPQGRRGSIDTVAARLQRVRHPDVRRGGAEAGQVSRGTADSRSRISWPMRTDSQAQGVSVVYPGRRAGEAVHALDDVSLTIDRGRVRRGARRLGLRQDHLART